MLDLRSPEKFEGQRRQIDQAFGLSLLLGLSIVIHLGFYFALSFVKPRLVQMRSDSDKGEITLQIVPDQNRQVSVNDSKVIKSQKAAKSLIGVAREKKDKKRENPSLNLNRTQDYYLNRMGRADGINSEAVYNKGDSPKSIPDNPEAVWGEGLGQLGRVADTQVMQAATEKVSGLVYYPGPLARRGIEGTVNARIIMNSKGQCDWSKSYVGGDRSELRFYILALLKKLCLTNFAINYGLRPSNNFDFSFHFDLHEKEEKPPKILGNVLLFEIPGHVPAGTWRLGPIKGNFMIPNMIFLDPGWIEENWNRLVLSKDPMQEYRPKN